MNAPSTLERPRIRVRKRRAPAKPARYKQPRELYLLAFLRSAWNSLRRLVHPLQFRRSSRRMQTLETLSLGDKRTVLLVRVDGQEFLLGATDKALSLLAKLDRPRDREKVTPLKSSPQVAELVANFNSSVQ